MLQFWQEIRNNERTEIDATNIVKEVIWNNRCIKINQKTVFFEKWYSKGILKIGDVIDENNNFLSFESLKRKYAIDINFVNYYRIISVIPRQWKQALKQARNETCNQSKTWYEDPSSFTTQKIYRHIKFKFAAPSSQNLLIQRGIATEDLNSIYLSLSYQSTTETFQIKILHNILPTNATLCKMKIKDSDLCPYCTSEKRALSHLFIECKLVCNFWKRFKIWWKENTNERVHLLALQILYGILGLSKNKQLINQLLLIAKYHIFLSYIREERNFGRFLLHVHRRYQIEQQISFKNQCTETFNRKWNSIYKA